MNFNLDNINEQNNIYYSKKRLILMNLAAIIDMQSQTVYGILCSSSEAT